MTMTMTMTMTTPKQVPVEELCCEGFCGRRVKPGSDLCNAHHEAREVRKDMEFLRQLRLDAEAHETQIEDLDLEGLAAEIKAGYR